MKFLVLAFISCMPLIGNAQVCDIRSSFTELTQGVNKEVICNETIFSLTGQYTLPENSTLVIQINRRQANTVELQDIVLSIAGKEVANTSGVLTWNPDRSDVVLD